MSYTIEQIKSAFNAGKHFNTYEDWINWSENEIRKNSISDPRILANKISEIGGEVRERESNHHILIDLLKTDQDSIHKFFKKELFVHRGYGKSENYHKYVSPKYPKMSIDYDYSWGFIEIFHQESISKTQEIREDKINTISE
jgi:hypothetical protein